MKTPKLPDTAKIIGIAQLAAILIIILVIYKILTSIGIIKTRAKKQEKENKEAADTDLSKVVQFNPIYLKDKLSGYTSLGSIAGSHVKMIHDSMYKFGGGTVILSVFARLHNKLNISEISHYYFAAFKRDLLVDIIRKLTKAEKVKLLQIINQMPTR